MRNASLALIMSLAMGALPLGAQTTDVQTKQYDDGGFYEGTFKDGMQHGLGTYRLPNGYEYSGEWIMGDILGEGRALFQSWCEAAGCSMGLDQMGNMFAQRDGTDPDALPVYVGSHLDTQPTGGKYDGVLGVLGGLELLRTMNDLGIKTKHPVVVTNWTNEEGTRYAPAMLSSGVFAGIHTQEWAYAKTDAEGLRFGDELKRIGWQGDEEVGARKMHAFFELHIEQGPILEAEGKDIGVVTHGQGLSWTQVTIEGKDSHTGSTPMPMRKNAGRGLALVTASAS